MRPACSCWETPRHQVVPVVTTGLHCGEGGGGGEDVEAVGRPRRHDGAPLRRRERGRCDVQDAARRPRRHDGAPLRRGLSLSMTGEVRGGRPRRHDGAPLRPPEKQVSRLVIREVVPVVTTGLHCGDADTGRVRRRLHRRPRRHDGAPLRPFGSCRSPVPRSPSSPSSRRGSIAAR